MKKMNCHKSGFALLYAVLLVSVVLIVGVLLMNIITKQLVLSSVSKNSEIAYYYVANSVRECLEYQSGKAVFGGATPPMDDNDQEIDPVVVDCFGDSNWTFTKDDTNPNIPRYYLSSQPVDIGGTNYLIDAIVYRNYSCYAEPSTCLTPTGNLYDWNSTVIIVTGYSSEGSSRQAKRTAVRVIH